MQATIRTEPRDHCFLCQVKGQLLYSQLQDRLFNAWGKWNLVQCSNKDCGLIWLNPYPSKEDIGKAYQTYFFHGLETNNKEKKGILQNVLIGLSCFLAFFSPLRLQRQRADYMYLDREKAGRLLDVGCGDGRRLALFKAKGWDVVGQEVDPESVKVAKAKYGLDVRLGDLEKLSFPDNFFDAITMNHVIEHLYDPRSVLDECYRILKSGGKLVMITPNSESFGHQYFQRSWLHLDPPRHLNIFSLKNLERLCPQGMFTGVFAFTTSINIYQGILSSIIIESKNNNVLKALTRPLIVVRSKAAIYLILGLIKNFINKRSGDECVVIAKKY